MSMTLARRIGPLLALLASAAWSADSSDLEVVYRIKQEAFKNSHVMQHLLYLTDVHGPRLTNSPGYDAAAQWVIDEAKEWGLQNAALEEWGPFGRGWSTSYFSAHMTEPQYSPLIGVPLAWTPGTDGVVSGVPIVAPLPAAVTSRRSDIEEAKAALSEYKERWKGRLENQIVMLQHQRRLSTQDSAANRRLSSTELSERAVAREPTEPLMIDPNNPVPPEDPALRSRFYSQLSRPARLRLRLERNAILYELNRFLVQEGVRLTIRSAGSGDGGTLFPPRAGRHNKEAIDPPPSIALTPEHYNRILRLLDAGIAPRIEVEVKTRFHQQTLNANNVVAEIPGASKADELVIIGAHLDDVGYATGATDNAAGCAVMMEVMRILSTLDLELDRTVRMVLWSGEEQGLLGSRAYVAEHYGERGSDELEENFKPEHARVSAYYNLDNGTGKIRGVYLQNNDMVRPIFSSWLAPFRDLGATTLSIRNTSGTDHLSFDAVGIPGFQFIQDPVEYNSRTHHSNMDVYDRVQAGDLMQAAAIIASFVYHTANREELLPRKPRP